MSTKSVMTLALVVVSLACASESERPDDSKEWVRSITREGNVTTVVDESGSVWGGTARLVEDLSIGVETGEDAYVFGAISGVAADESRIYVLDSQVPALRVYDHQGVHVLDIGGEGQGPGEFDRLVDVFEIDGGRYLGELEIPTGLALNPEPFVDDGVVVGIFQGDDGTIRVKRYRVVMPGEAQ